MQPEAAACHAPHMGSFAAVCVPPPVVLLSRLPQIKKPEAAVVAVALHGVAGAPTTPMWICVAESMDWITQVGVMNTEAPCETSVVTLDPKTSSPTTAIGLPKISVPVKLPSAAVTMLLVFVKDGIDDIWPLYLAP